MANTIRYIPNREAKSLAESDASKEQLEAAATASNSSLSSLNVGSIEVSTLQTSTPGLSFQNHHTRAFRMPNPVIKHLGRLISTDGGIDRFAGSTTGVHFVHIFSYSYSGAKVTRDFQRFTDIS